MATYTEAQMRDALKTVVTAAAPNAVVFPWWVLGHDSNMWPGKLRPVAGPDADKVHGYVFTRTQTDGERLTACRVQREFAYDIWGFHFYDETSTNTTSSDIRFNAELDAICGAFVIGTGLPDAIRRVKEEPQFRLDLGTFGGELLHYAIGRLVVEQC